MLTNVVTSQVIRLVTERVIENLSRQAGRPGASTGGPSDLATMAALAQLNERLAALDGRLDKVDSRLRRFDERIGSVERRVGWRYTLRVTFGVAGGLIFGFGAATAAHLLGWLG